MKQTKVIVISGYCSRKEVASILKISERALFKLLTSDALKDKVPKRERLSPAHQQLIFERAGIPYVFQCE